MIFFNNDFNIKISKNRIVSFLKEAQAGNAIKALYFNYAKAMFTFYKR